MIGVDPACAELLTIRNLFLNPTNNKFPVSVDVHIPIEGTEMSYAKLFIGHDVSKTGNVISVRYDEAGNVLDDRLALVKNDPSDPANFTYSIREGNIIKLLPENTTVTLVIYNSTGGGVRFRTLGVKYNHLTANLNNSASFIKDIVLEHAWVDPQNPNRLLVPVSVLESTFNPTIRKVYQNNREELISESDLNLSVDGWGGWTLPRAGVSFPIVVKYQLKEGERSVVTDPYLGSHIAKVYDAVIVDRGTGIVYYVHVLPEYVDTVIGYRLRAYLFNSDYSARLDVSSKISYTAFNGKAWGSKQTINYTLRLNDVVEVASNDIISGSITIEVVGKPLDKATAYRLYTHPKDLTPYGNDLRLVLRPGIGIYNLDISVGKSQQANWLEEMYYKLNPYYDPLTAETAPTPTHVDVQIGNTLLTYRMDEWETHKLFQSALPTNGALADVVFYILTANNDRLELVPTKMYVEIV
jgi:hypothetical protein